MPYGKRNHVTVYILLHNYVFFSEFKVLIIDHCDLATTKLITKYRKFDYIEIKHYIYDILDDIYMTTKRLKVSKVFLEDILTSECINTKSLTCEYFCENFNNNIFPTRIG